MIEPQAEESDAARRNAAPECAGSSKYDRQRVGALLQDRRVGVAALLAAVALGGVAQAMLLARPNDPRLGAALFAIAIPLLLLTLRRLERLPDPSGATDGWRSLLTRFWLAAGMMTIAIVGWFQAVHLSLYREPTLAERGFLLWVTSLTLFVGGLLLYFGRRPRTWRHHLWAARFEVAGIGGLTLLALLLRVTHVDVTPYPLQGDEGSVGTEAVRIVQGRVVNMFHAGWSGQPNLSFLPVALFIHLLGPDVLGVRMLSVIQGAATVPLLYPLGRRLFGPMIGLIAATFLTAWHYHIHFSRLAVNNVGDAFFAVLVFWLLHRALEVGRPLDYLWAGLATGLTWYSYVGARLVFLLALFYIAVAAVRDRAFFPRSWSGALIYFGALALTAGPQMLYFRDHPDQFMARMNQVGILQSGWLEREAALLDVSAWTIVADQVARSYLVFVSVPVRLGFYNAQVPLLDFCSAVLFVLGLALAISRLPEHRYTILVSWFWAVIILGGALTVDVPNVARLVLAAPAVCLLIGVALSELAGGVYKLGLASRPAVCAVAAVVVLGASLSSIDFYFRRFVPSHHFADANSELGHEVGYYLRQFGGDYTVYMSGAPRFFVGFPSIPFLAPNAKGRDREAPLTAQTIPRLPPEGKAVFLATPERRGELEIVRRGYPGGHWQEFLRRTKPEPLFFAYVVSVEPPR